MTTYNKKEEEDEDAKDKYVVWCIGAWVTYFGKIYPFLMERSD